MEIKIVDQKREWEDTYANDMKGDWDTKW